MSALAELIEPGSILDMSQSDLESLISTIRERRSRVVKARSVAHHRARASGVLSLRPKLEKLATRLDRILTKLDTDLAKAEKLVREVTAMRLELGDATPGELADELRAAGTLCYTTPPHAPHGDDALGDDDGAQEQGDDEGLAEASQEQCDEGEVSGSQERPQPGVTNS
jgi:hypothetical protein